MGLRVCSPGVAEGSCDSGGTGGRVSLPLTAVFHCSLTDRNVRVQKVFNGYLRITNENFLDAYENSSSTEFANLAKKVKEAVSPVPGQSPGPAVVSGTRTLAQQKGGSPLLPDAWAGVRCGLPGTWEGAPGPRREGAAWVGARGHGRSLDPSASSPSLS